MEKYKNIRVSHRPFRPSVAIARDDEDVVQNNLAVTPSKMLELMNEGIAVSAGNQSLLKSQDVGDSDWTIPVERQRGIDPLADGWTIMMDIKDKIRHGAKKAFDAQALEGAAGDVE